MGNTLHKSVKSIIIVSNLLSLISLFTDWLFLGQYVVKDMYNKWHFNSKTTTKICWKK